MSPDGFGFTKQEMIRHIGFSMATDARRFLQILTLFSLSMMTPGCAVYNFKPSGTEAPARKPNQVLTLETTGYCPCGACCGWKRNWLGRPVIKSGPLAGQPKKVGFTASGTRARRGTLAADTSRFPFGTIIFIPGYGYGRVEDRGGDIVGNRVDLFFPRHSEAAEWGRVRKTVQVWLPRSGRP